MRIEMAGATARAEADFTCTACGHRARAVVVGLGEGAATFLNSEGTSERRAEADAEADIARTLGLARCPSCGTRDATAVAWFWAPWVGWPAAAMVGSLIVGFWPMLSGMNMSDRDKAICAWLIPLICAVSMVLVVPLSVLPRWNTLDARVKWIDPPKPPEPGA
jgi:hypothetical protein